MASFLGYDWTPRGCFMDGAKITYRKYDIQRRFGVELEIGSEVKKKDIQSLILKNSDHFAYVTRYALSSENSYWHIKDDATCGLKGRKGPKGVEIASYIGKNLSDIEHISAIATKLLNFGCKANENCGLHIHAEVADLTTSQVAVIVSHWIKLEKLLSVILPSRRHKSEHCKFIFPPLEESSFFGLKRNKNYDVDEFWSFVCPKNLSYYDNNDRRYNLNLVNLVRAMRDNSPNRRTIELRWPEGTLESNDIKSWVIIFLLFIENCKNKSMPQNLKPFGLEEALSIMGLHHDKKCFVIMSKTIHETKTWFLERILKHYEDSLNIYGHDFVNSLVKEAKEILNLMWNPVRNYS